MERWFELWDSESANLVGTYHTKSEALEILRHALTKHGPEGISGLVLSEEGNTEESLTVIAAGDELVRLAQREFGSPLRG